VTNNLVTATATAIYCGDVLVGDDNLHKPEQENESVSRSRCNRSKKVIDDEKMRMVMDYANGENHQM
jgi:hypothetical protein